MAKRDLREMANWLRGCRRPPCRWWFRKIGLKHGIPPALLAAIASRETRGGAYLRPSGRSPEYPSNTGYGLMQIEPRHHPGAKRYGPHSYQHIEQAAIILKNYLAEVKRKHPEWKEAWQLRGMLVAYNTGGADDVDTQGKIDEGTWNDDYSSDIWQRARYYAFKHPVMLGKHCRRRRRAR